jgi:LysM domain
MPPISGTHEVQAGETLSGIASQFNISLQELLAANPQISNPNLIMIGAIINIPSTEPAPPPSPAPGNAVAFDGEHPAPGTISTNRAALIFPPITNTPGNRQRNIYDQIINQFAVAHNPRYISTGGDTFCNIFSWDVTRAMGLEVQIPHWINASGEIRNPFTAGANEVNVNGTVSWIEHFGPAHGWTPTNAQGAQDAANEGRPAVAMRRNPAGHGHIAIVRPGSINSRGPATAQAGRHNFNMGHLRDGFGDLPNIKFFMHD